MKTRYTLMLALMASLLFSTHLSAATLDSYGGLDNLLYETNLSSSGDAVEESWIESVLGFDVNFGDKINFDDSATGWNTVDGYDSYYAYDLSGSTDSLDYFLVKTGTGSDDGNTHFLFENLDSLAWAVIDLAAMGFDTTKIDITKVSHVSSIGDPSEVPLPAAAWLFLSGLAGLSYFSRKKKGAVTPAPVPA